MGGGGFTEGCGDGRSLICSSGGHRSDHSTRGRRRPDRRSHPTRSGSYRTHRALNARPDGFARRQPNVPCRARRSVCARHLSARRPPRAHPSRLARDWQRAVRDRRVRCAPKLRKISCAPERVVVGVRFGHFIPGIEFSGDEYRQWRSYEEGVRGFHPSQIFF